MTTPALAAPVLPLVMFDTNVLFDFFLGRDPEILLLAGLSPQYVEIRVPEFVLMEFRGSILRELGKIEDSLNGVRRLANELDRADHTMSGVDPLRAGCELAALDLAHLRTRVDPVLEAIRRNFNIVPHTQALHYLGDLRFVRGLPPDKPRRGVQDCRIFEAVLEIARQDVGVARPARFLLTKDSDFLGQQGVRDELLAVGVTLVGAAGPIYGPYGPRP
ncbi:MAG: PIN domain-containing protein [Polyangiaceae bacterium]